MARDPRELQAFLEDARGIEDERTARAMARPLWRLYHDGTASLEVITALLELRWWLRRNGRAREDEARKRS